MGRDFQMSFMGDFKNPGCEYRGKPFWAWNGRLEKSELERQLGVFKKMGFGGAFMHARVGLGTPYLSKEWFDLIDVCARKCEKEDMQAWLYDEDRWPSGAAGGLVTKDERYRMRFISVDVVADPASFKFDGKEIALFSAKIVKRDAKSVKRLAKGAPVALAKGESLLVFREEPHPLRSWYNGYAYLDTMNEEAVDKFIEVTHEQYLKHNGKDFGKTIPGIFADEPHYGHGRCFDKTHGTAQWTGKLPATFKSRYGYDLLDHLPELFFFVDGELFSQARHDYYDCITHLFVNAFGRKIYEFCEKAGIEFTGHVLQEPTLISQLEAVGSCMRFYEFMQAPGIDVLCAQGLQRRDGSRYTESSTAKQVESMRRQFGRKRFLSELYGCTGWNFTFAQHKAVGDWQAAMGVNLRCQHLAWYTMEGEAKRDYPASISFQSAWCEEYKAVEDYFSRVNVTLAQGEAVRDVAVLHPIESAWGAYIVKQPNGNYEGDNSMNFVAEKLNERFFAAMDVLLQGHCDFDFIDEEIISRYGSVEASKLKVNLASYKVVVVPPVLCLRESTAKLLEDFAKAGGKVYMLANDAELVKLERGGALDKLKAFAKPVALKALVKTVKKAGASGISVRSVKGGSEYPECLYMMRRDEKAGLTVVFVTHNIQNASSGALEVEIPAVGKAYELDAVSGRVVALPGAKATKNGSTVIKTSLEAYGSRLFIIEDAGKSSLKADAEAKELKKLSSKALQMKAVDFVLSEPNAIALDMAEVKVAKDFNGPFDILKLDRVVRDALGLPYRCGDMVQPWARTPVPGAKEGRVVELLFNFKVEKIPAGKTYLVMERPSEFKANLNNAGLPLKSEGNWLDNSFHKILLPKGSLVEGWNSLVISTTYTADSDLEYLYLLGDFGARRDENGVPVLCAMPERVGLGDWEKYGLGSFTGALSYIVDAEFKLKKGERAFLKLGKWEGVAVKAIVDGKAAGSIDWPPYELDITDALAGKTKARIEIQVFAGRRNLLGPLHLSDRHPWWTGPAQYVSDTRFWSPLPVHFETGLMDAPLLVVKG